MSPRTLWHGLCALSLQRCQESAEGAPQNWQRRWRLVARFEAGGATKVKYVQTQGELHFESGEFFKTISTLVFMVCCSLVMFYRCTSMIGAIGLSIFILFACGLHFMNGTILSSDSYGQLSTCAEVFSWFATMPLRPPWNFRSNCQIPRAQCWAPSIVGFWSLMMTPSRPTRITMYWSKGG